MSELSSRSAAASGDGAVPPSAAASQTERPKDPVASLAAQVRHAQPGVLARLRRFSPQTEAQAALFETEWMLQAAQVPLSEPTRPRWALLLHCLAIARGLHDPRTEAAPGSVLARLRWSEARMRQLVEADAQVLADLMPRLARRVAAAGAALDWRPLAELLLHAGTDHEERADAARRRIVMQYLQAQGRLAGDAAGTTAND